MESRDDFKSESRRGRKEKLQVVKVIVGKKRNEFVGEKNVEEKVFKLKKGGRVSIGNKERGE